MMKYLRSFRLLSCVVGVIVCGGAVVHLLRTAVDSAVVSESGMAADRSETIASREQSAAGERQPTVQPAETAPHERFLGDAFFGLSTVGKSQLVMQQRGDDEIAARPLKADMREFMLKKLVAAQKALDGVAADRFDVVEASGNEMIQLSRHAAWQQLASASYIQDTADFVQAAEFMNRMAQEENADATALAYSRLILCCSNCHQHVRLPPMADLTTRHADYQLASVR